MQTSFCESCAQVTEIDELEKVNSSSHALQDIPILSKTLFDLKLSSN